MRRRTYLASAASATAAALALAGCSARSSPTDGTETTPETTDTDSTDTDTTSGEEPSWTATTDCDSMHENVIEVEWTTDDVRDAYSPIQFSELTAGEKEILGTVVEDGGFANCEVTDAFRRFVERVMAHRKEQDEFLVYLEYEGTYYGLYVQQGDQVFSAG